MACETDSSIHPQERWDREHHRQNPQTCTAAVRPAATAPRSTCLRVCILLAAALATSPQAGAQQMDPAAMQRQIQQQMGGSPGGGGGGGGGAPPPNRIGEETEKATSGGALPLFGFEPCSLGRQDLNLVSSHPFRGLRMFRALWRCAWIYVLCVGRTPTGRLVDS